MQGVVSLLDADHYQLVEDLWRGLEEALGLRGVYVTPFPHFSYHLAEHYDLDAVASVLRDVAASTPPFEVLTSGLGIFTAGIHPVVYVNVTRGPEMSALNARLWPLLGEAGTGIAEYYHPTHWVPHITLAHGDVTDDNLSKVITLLSKWDFTWQIAVENIALLFDENEDAQDRIYYRFPLTGG